jgi:hypothetical protein
LLRYLYVNDIILKFLNEEITDKDLEKKLKEFMGSKAFTDKIKSTVSDEIKSDKELEKFVVDITRQSLEQLYKTLWTKRNFWKSHIK